MSGQFPATERWFEEIGATRKHDRQRASANLERDQKLARVRVQVPAQHRDKITTFARLLRNCSDEEIAQYQRDFEDYQRDAWEHFDSDRVSGETNPDSDD